MPTACRQLAEGPLQAQGRFLARERVAFVLERLSVCSSTSHFATDCRMPGNEAKRIFEKGLPRLGAMPSGSSGGVWERNEVLLPSVKVHLPTFANHIGQRVKRQELRDRQPSHWEHQFGSKELKLAPQPVRTLLNFEVARNPIPTTRIFSREAAADCGEVDPAAHGFFVPVQSRLKPAKERLTRRPGEWTTEDRFLTTWSLTNQEDAARHRASHHHRSVHARAAAAGRQRVEVRAQRAHDPPKSTETIRKAR